MLLSGQKGESQKLGLGTSRQQALGTLQSSLHGHSVTNCLEGSIHTLPMALGAFLTLED